MQLWHYICISVCVVVTSMDVKCEPLYLQLSCHFKSQAFQNPSYDASLFNELSFFLFNILDICCCNRLCVYKLHIYWAASYCTLTCCPKFLKIQVCFSWLMLNELYGKIPINKVWSCKKYYVQPAILLWQFLPSSVMFLNHMSLIVCLPLQM